ncbi:MAG: DUF3150 domain-containing protein [Pseudomonadota bacterium]|nr:DUF3150 domain-containing protein [Pseudomonadota bacterium]
MTQQVKVLDNLFLIENNTRFWSGTSRITEDYLKSLGIDIETLLNKDNNDETATLGGTVKIIDPKHLRSFHALRKRVERYLQSVGVRFLGGYATPLDRKDAISQCLSTFKADYDTILADFTRDYQFNLNNWAYLHPEWKNLILQVAPDTSSVERRFKFDWNEYQIKPVSDGDDGDDKDETAQSPAEAKILNSLSDNLFDEIADDARKLWERLQGRKSVKSVSINPLRQMNVKLAGLCIIDPRIEPVAQAIKEVLSFADMAIQDKKEIDSLNLAAINGLLLLLSNPDNVKEAGRLAIEHNSGAIQYVAELEAGPETDAQEKEEPQSMEDWMQDNNYIEPEIFPETNNPQEKDQEPEEEPQSMEDWILQGASSLPTAVNTAVNQD